VIDKPAGLVVHPGAGNTEKTLVHALLARYPQMAGVGSMERPGIVHRLDKLTSGVIVIAKTQQAYIKLAEAFKEHAHKRVYICICFGGMQKNSGRIETLINRNPVDRKKMTSKVRSGRPAITNWEVMKSWPGFSMLKLSLETGRTHQIRVHLSDTGHPIVGDAEYGGRGRAANIANTDMRVYVKSIDRQMLHAHILGINHPETGEYMEFVSPLPGDMLLLEQELNRNYS
jgi:23S rRNA pseudouridine1911/1915/1917 synthase